MSIKLIADLHTHTQYSDGVTTIEDNVAAAHAAGLKYIAITDHGPRQLSSGISIREVPEYRRKIDRINAKYAGEITVLMGIESNLVSLEGDIDVTEQYRELYDIILMGYHKTAKPMTSRDANHFWVNTLGLRNSHKPKMVQKTTDAYIKAVQRNRIDIVVHPRHNIDVNVGQLARACARRDTALEISARRDHLKMTPQDIADARREGAFFVINSDGHRMEQISDFKLAVDFAGKAGLTEQDIFNAEGYSGRLPVAFKDRR